MPASPEDGARLAQRVVELYADSELSLLRRLARALRKGIDAPTWAEDKLAQLALIRAGIQKELSGLNAAAGTAIQDAILRAWQAGGALAIADLDDAGKEVEALPPAQHGAIQRIAQETLQAVTGATPGILRNVLDVYQQVVAEASSTVITGANTRRDAAQQALDRLLGRGITGFRDKAGRSWNLASYVEMAVRTGTGHAAVQGHVDHLSANGVDLVIVSDSPRECPLCRPWERQVLSISGGVAGVVSTGGVRVRVAGSLDAARAAGLQHPNCRHSVSAYLPGFTVKGHATREPDGYQQQQRQRAIERNIRAWKRRQALALGTPAEQQAAAKVRYWQAQMRDHLAAHPALKRQSGREQIKRAI